MIGGAFNRQPVVIPLKGQRVTAGDIDGKQRGAAKAAYDGCRLAPDSGRSRRNQSQTVIFARSNGDGVDFRYIS